MDYLYGVVALDDAGAVVLFGVVFAVAAELLGTGDHGAAHLVVHALREVGLSLVAGMASGTLIHTFACRKSNSNEVLIITLGMLFITTAFAIIFELSPLLTNMTAGAVIINLGPQNHRIFRFLEPFTPPIYALFFVIAGTELRPQILAQSEILLLGSVYIVARALGKYGGVYAGAAMSRVEPEIRQNLGICMFPQAGVAIGLVLNLYEDDLLYAVLEIFIEEGIEGATIMESAGMGEYISNVPLFADFIGFMRENKHHSRTLLALVPQEHVQEIIRRIEEVTGDLDTKQGAMIMVLDVPYFKGTMQMM